jgi:hypothetical protein
MATSLPSYYAGLLNSYTEIEGSERQVTLLGGMFKPAGTGAPTSGSPGKSFWNVARLSAGVFQVTLVGNPGAGTSSPATTIAKIQSVLATLQIDPAGSPLNLQVQVGPVTGSTFVLLVTAANTGIPTDITQPGSPTNQGSFVHWTMLTSNDNVQTLNLPQLASKPYLNTVALPPYE